MKTGIIGGANEAAMIAATAISQQVALATLNTTDFKFFTPHGLVLAIPLEP